METRPRRCPLEAPIWVSVSFLSGEIAPVHKTAYLEPQTQHMRRWIACHEM